MKDGSSKKLRILLIGASGFVGKRLLEVLSRKESNVLSYPGRESLDVTNLGAFASYFSDVDVIINLVGRFEPPFSSQLRLNTLALENISANAIKHKVGKVVHISTAAVYGAKNRRFVENERPLPDTTYGLSKLFGEEVLGYYYYTYGLKSIIIRPTNIYGPGSDHGAVYSLISSLKDKGKITLYGDGMQTRDFVHVDDVVEVIRKAIKHKADFEVFNVGTGVNTRLIDLADYLVGRDRGKINFKEAETFKSKDLKVNITKVKTELGWKPRYSLEQGIKTIYGKL